MSDEDDRRRPGRPRLAKNDTSVVVSLSMPSRQYDSLCQRAQRERVSVQDLIRRAVSTDDADQ